MFISQRFNHLEYFTCILVYPPNRINLVTIFCRAGLAIKGSFGERTYFKSKGAKLKQNEKKP